MTILTPVLVTGPEISWIKDYQVQFNPDTFKHFITRVWNVLEIKVNPKELDFLKNWELPDVASFVKKAIIETLQ